MLGNYEAKYNEIKGTNVWVGGGAAGKIVGYNLERECYIAAMIHGWGSDELTKDDHIDIKGYDSFVYVMMTNGKA